MPGGRQILVRSQDALSDEERRRHERYMQMAIDLLDGCAPFSAVIVDHESGEVLCHGVNRGRENRIYHGEIDAMINCRNQHPDVDWSKLTLYSTAEPCPICMSALIWNGIPRLIYGTSIQTLTSFGVIQIGLDTATVADAAPFYSGEIIGGILHERTDEMLKTWWDARMSGQG